MKIDIINAACDLGVNVDGASIGPFKIKEYLENNKKINNIIAVQCNCQNKENEIYNLRKNYNRLIEYTKHLYNEILKSKNQGAFSITIGGDHSIATSSALASIKKENDLGIIWIDAHADYNTFETTITGNLHGLPLATINGLNKELSLFHDGKYYDPKKTVIIGYRSEEENKDEEINNLKEAGVTFYTTNDLKEKGIQETMKKAFEIATNNNNNRTHISYDIDFIDPKEAPGVSIPELNGPTKKEALEVAEEMLKYIKYISSIDIVEYNPKNDINNVTLNIVLKIIEMIINKIEKNNAQL